MIRESFKPPFGHVIQFVVHWRRNLHDAWVRPPDPQDMVVLHKVDSVFRSAPVKIVQAFLDSLYYH